MSIPVRKSESISSQIRKFPDLVTPPIVTVKLIWPLVGIISLSIPLISRVAGFIIEVKLSIKIILEATKDTLAPVSIKKLTGNEPQ